MIRSIIFSILFLLSLSGFAQSDSLSAGPERTEPVYRLKPAVDIPVTAAGIGWSIFAFPKIYNKESSTVAEIESLRVEDINGFDRWAADKFSDKADATSDVFFYAS